MRRLLASRVRRTDAAESVLTCLTSPAFAEPFYAPPRILDISSSSVSVVSHLPWVSASRCQ